MAKLIPHDAVPFSELARQLRSRPSRATVYSWWYAGRKNRRTGETVKLETCRTPAGRGSTIEKVDEFFLKLD